MNTDIRTAINSNHDTVLYSQGFANSKPSMIGSTLFATNQNDSGFFVAEDVNIVLQQLNKKMETTFETGVDELEDIIDSLNEKYDNTGFHYWISAILEDGAATTVVIYDDADPYEPNEPTYTGDGTANGELVLDGLKGKVYQRNDADPVDIVSAIEDYFGVTNIDDLDTDLNGDYKVKVGTKTYTIDATVQSLGKVTLSPSWGTLTSPSDVYLADGETIVVTVKNAAFTQYHVDGVTVSHGGLDITEKSIKDDTITLVLTANQDFILDGTVTINWP